MSWRPACSFRFALAVCAIVAFLLFRIAAEAHGVAGRDRRPDGPFPSSVASRRVGQFASRLGFRAHNYMYVDSTRNPTLQLCNFLPHHDGHRRTNAPRQPAAAGRRRDAGGSRLLGPHVPEARPRPVRHRCCSSQRQRMSRRPRPPRRPVPPQGRRGPEGPGALPRRPLGRRRRRG